MDNQQHELTSAQKEAKQALQMVSELKVANANLENQVANLRRETDEARQEAKQTLQALQENRANDAELDRDEDFGGQGERVPLAEAQEEIQRVQTHYESEIVSAKKERVELVSKIQELVAQNERIKLESNKQLSSYKNKYSEYKTKLRKANQNIATLLTRLAKFDIQMKAEKDGEQQTDRAGNSEPRMNNYAKWAYQD